jgi:hypothetical protein
MTGMKLYLRTPHTGNEFRVCNEVTDEVVAIFYNQKDGANYIKMREVLNTLVGEIEYDGAASQKTIEKAKQIIE